MTQTRNQIFGIDQEEESIDVPIILFHTFRLLVIVGLPTSEAIIYLVEKIVRQRSRPRVNG